MRQPARHFCSVSAELLGLFDVYSSHVVVGASLALIAVVCAEEAEAASAAGGVALTNATARGTNSGSGPVNLLPEEAWLRGRRKRGSAATGTSRLPGDGAPRANPLRLSFLRVSGVVYGCCLNLPLHCETCTDPWAAAAEANADAWPPAAPLVVDAKSVHELLLDDLLHKDTAASTSSSSNLRRRSSCASRKPSTSRSSAGANSASATASASFRLKIHSSASSIDWSRAPALLFSVLMASRSSIRCISAATSTDFCSSAFI